MSEPRATLLVVTDLDGTLLDAETYALDPAREALDALRAADVPLVVATSKTRAEIEPIGAMIGGTSIFIVENGGAILLPKSHDIDAGGRRPAAMTRPWSWNSAHRAIDWSPNSRTSRWRAAPRSAASRSSRWMRSPRSPGCRNRRHGSPRNVPMTSRFSSTIRTHIPALAEAARRRGLRVTRGGRLHHLTGDTDKGRALGVLLRELTRGPREPFTIGLGDAANDLPFLHIVDRPIVIPRPDGVIDPALAAALPDAELAPYPGPAGWNLAVLAVLAGRSLPRVGGATPG